MDDFFFKYFLMAIIFLQVHKKVFEPLYILIWVLYYIGNVRFWYICFHCEIDTNLGYQGYLKQWLKTGPISLEPIRKILKLFTIYLWTFVLFCASYYVFTFVYRNYYYILSPCPYTKDLNLALQNVHLHKNYKKMQEFICLPC